MAKGNGSTRATSSGNSRGLSDSSNEAMFHGHIVSNPLLRGEKVIDIAGRKIIMMQFGDQEIPFYLSTGRGGKADVPAGHWYPFFGFSEEGIKGWFIKGEGLADYYGDDRLRAAAKYLDEKFGDRRNDEKWGKKIKANTQEHRDMMRAINAKVNPNNYGLREFYGKKGELERLLIEPIKRKLKL